MDRAFVTATLIVVLASWAPYVPTAAVAQTAPDDAAAPAKFSADQIDQMVAPVALYPDALLAQIFIASTYPLEIVEADRWRRQNASLKDDALDKALEQKDWDPSIKSLTKMPDLLKRLSDNLDWTKDLGDAFLAQKDDVMSAVQAMRQKASEAGNLKTSEQQTVTKEVVNNKETIVIQPTNPETVYVPSYPPTVYGSTYAPTTPYYGAPAYGYTGAQMATTGLLAFGTGVAVGALVTDGFGWGNDDVHVNNNYYGNGGGGGGGGNNNNTNVNVNKNVDRSKTVNKGGQSWQHNPEHRRNVEYRDPSTQKKFDSRNPNAARDRQARDQARGFDSGNAGNRGGAGDRGGAGNRGDVGNRGGAGNRGDVGSRGDAGNRGGGDRGGNRGGAGGQGGDRGQTRSASAGKSGALGDYGSGQASRQASQRGASSRGSQSYAGSGGGGQRGGGGGGGGQRASGGGGGGRGGGGGGGRGGGGGGRGGGGGGGRRR